MRIINVVGARPNFMKVAPVHACFVAQGHEAHLVHTGQHYDANMSEVFLSELGMPKPDLNLEVGSGSHAEQTANILLRFEPIVREIAPDLVLVAGDVNSTIACALAAVKMGIPVAHLEAGLRSFDESMPEEINRMLTDRISRFLLTPSADADANLKREGLADSRIMRVGNAMIDSLRQHRRVAEHRDTLQRLGLQRHGFALVTLHRSRNVDDPAILGSLVRAIRRIAARISVVFPLHPRTAAALVRHGLRRDLEGSVGFRTPGAGSGEILCIEPLGYLDFLALQCAAKLVLTDSGGIQEETTALGVPCLTARDNTERPITIDEGTNTLVGTDCDTIVAHADDILTNGGKKGRIPLLWDGETAPRVVAAVTGGWRH